MEKKVVSPYLIYINSKSEPVLVTDVPDKPEPMNVDSKTFGKIIKLYEEDLEAALSDESKHIQFKDVFETWKIMDKAGCFSEGRTMAESVGQTFPLPEGVSMRFEEYEISSPDGCESEKLKLALLVQEPKVEEQKKEPVPLIDILKNSDRDRLENIAYQCFEELSGQDYEFLLSLSKNREPEEQLKEKHDLYTELKNWLCEIVPHDNWAGKKVTKDDGQYFAINDGKRFVAFNHDTKFGKTFFGIREDGDSRTVFNGVVETLEDAKRIWYLTDPSN